MNIFNLFFQKRTPEPPLLVISTSRREFTCCLRTHNPYRDRWCTASTPIETVRFLCFLRIANHFRAHLHNLLLMRTNLSRFIMTTRERASRRRKHTTYDRVFQQLSNHLHHLHSALSQLPHHHSPHSLNTTQCTTVSTCTVSSPSSPSSKKTE